VYLVVVDSPYADAHFINVAWVTALSPTLAVFDSVMRLLPLHFSLLMPNSNVSPCARGLHGFQKRSRAAYI
jgi:hypothetical protein